MQLFSLLYEDAMRDSRGILKKVYFSGLEADAVEDRAASLGLSESAYLRRLALLDLEYARQKRVCAEELSGDRPVMGPN